MNTNKLFADFNKVFKAIKGDLIAHYEIEAKYGRMKTMEDLQDLGTKLYNRMTKEEQNMTFLQAELTLQVLQEIRMNN